MAKELDEFETLLTRARTGDQKAMTQLVEQYEVKVRIVARVQLGSALRPYLDSIDLVQSVHRSLMLGLREDRFDISSPDKLLGLALLMVRRKVARCWRRMRRQQRLDEGAVMTDDLTDLLTSISCPRANPAES